MNSQAKISITTSTKANTNILESSKVPTERLGMYERSMLRLQERKQKLALLEQELMRECTFTPNINSAFSQADQTPPWERLHRQEVKKKSPIKSYSSKRLGSSSQQSCDVMSSVSSRIDKLYQDGRRQLQDRNGKTNKTEGEARRRRFEDLQLRHSTLKPKLCESTRPLSSIRCELFPPSFPLPPRGEPAAFAVNNLPNGHDVVFGTPQRTRIYKHPPRPFNSETSPLRHLIAFAASSVASPLRDPMAVTLNFRSTLEVSMTFNPECGSILGSDGKALRKA